MGYNKQNFSQIMLNNSLKRELYFLKPIIAEKLKATWKLSFNDVLDYLVIFYKKNCESQKNPTIVIPGPITVINPGDIILPEREVINYW